MSRMEETMCDMCAAYGTITPATVHEVDTAKTISVGFGWTKEPFQPKILDAPGVVRAAGPQDAAYLEAASKLISEAAEGDPGEGNESTEWISIFCLLCLSDHGKSESCV